MKITTEKKVATYRVIVKNERDNSTVSFPIYLDDGEQYSKEFILESIKECIQNHKKTIPHKAKDAK